MKTVQMTLDELIEEVDRVSKLLHASRSAFTRNALRESLARCGIEEQELKHREGYERYPVNDEEFSVWDTEQVWGGQ